MQWLIDLILDKIRLDGLAANRGDPAAEDFTTVFFVQDNAWHLLDLSGIIPENAHVVYIYAIFSATIVNAKIRIQTKGHANERNRSQLRTVVANLNHDVDIVAFPDSARNLVYRVLDPNFTYIGLTVKGWDF